MTDARPSNCECCGSTYMIQWSDLHGVGACVTCGLPSRVLHYEDRDGKNVRIDKPPSVYLNDGWLPIGQRYWRETHRRVFPAAYDMGFGERDERSYSGATREDLELWNAWLTAHADELPKAANDEAAA